MANFMDKLQVNTAITDHTKLDLGHQHITTLDFMELQPSLSKEMVPGEKIDVKMESFARLNPLPVPTFGRASLRHRAFFVPYRTIFRGWNDFITDAVHVPSTISSPSAIISSVPFVTNDILVHAFLDSSAGSNINVSDPEAYEAVMNSNYLVFGILTDGQSIPPHDLDVAAPGGGHAYFDLTTLGRQCFKVLESLGYKIIWSSAKSTEANYPNVSFNALPLLALVKIYTDWYWPQQYTNLASYDDLVSLCNRDSSNDSFGLTSTQVRDILTICSYVQYDSDLFTCAWDTPNQPTIGTHSIFRINNVDSARQLYQRFNGSTTNIVNNNISPSYVTNNSGSAQSPGTSSNDLLGQADAPFISPLVSGKLNDTNTNTTPPAPISQYLLTALQALTDYMKRHQLVGSKAADRYLARFGKSLTAEQLNRSVYLGCHMQDVQIGDVMSTADTEGSNLGSYAGKGLSYGNGQFDYQTDEFGLFIVLTSLVPNTGYFQGIDRNLKHLTRLDFYTPEFDSLGCQAVGADELYVPEHYGSAYDGIWNQVFGFLPTYYEYKTKLDKVTGNFRVNSINGANPLTPSEFNASNSWYLMRVFDNEDYPSAVSIVHGASFLNGRNDSSQFKRIFYDVKGSSPDNFTVIHNFEIASWSPMKSLFDTYEFEDKGKKVTEDVNGVKMN